MPFRNRMNVDCLEFIRSTDRRMSSPSHCTFHVSRFTSRPILISTRMKLPAASVDRGGNLSRFVAIAARFIASA
jgi:hypothetical protein